MRVNVVSVAALGYLVTVRTLAAASLVAVTYATAMAQSASATAILQGAVSMAGTVSVGELSAGAANQPQMQQIPEVEAPPPGNAQASAPSKEMLETLPLAPEANMDVKDHLPFRQINGFTGITNGAEQAVRGGGNPPDQGLAVHDNVIAEIVN